MKDLETLFTDNHSLGQAAVSAMFFAACSTLHLLEPSSAPVQGEHWAASRTPQRASTGWTPGFKIHSSLPTQYIWTFSSRRSQHSPMELSAVWNPRLAVLLPTGVRLVLVMAASGNMSCSAESTGNCKCLPAFSCRASRLYKVTYPHEVRKDWKTERSMPADQFIFSVYANLYLLVSWPVVMTDEKHGGLNGYLNIIIVYIVCNIFHANIKKDPFCLGAIALSVQIPNFSQDKKRFDLGGWECFFTKARLIKGHQMKLTAPATSVKYFLFHLMLL